MTTRVDSEIVLFMDSCTGEIVIEGISCDCEQSIAKPDNIRKFHTGLTYDASLAAKIRFALNRKGIKVSGINGKCINISKDWLVQILVILYYGLLDRTISERLAYLIKAANNNFEWKNNRGIELQKSKEKEYWNKVGLFDRTKRAKTVSAVHFQPKRIGIKTLIVEDELLSGRILQRFITPLGECDLVNNGSEAIKAFTKAIDQGEKYDLITIDIMMPEMNGHEVLKHIRSLEEKLGTSSVKIIMTTALDDVKVIMSAFKEQCDGYIVKPIRKDVLMKRLRDLNLLDR